MNKKLLFYFIWILLLSISTITVFLVTPWSIVSGNNTLTVNLIQRVIALWAYTLLFIQLLIGAYMEFWIKKFGGWIFNFHVTEGKLIYLLIILHPLAFTLFNFYIGKGFDPFYAFVDVCVICKKSLEFSYNFGRIGFWLLTLGTFAGLFRAASPFLRIHWRKFHTLNYLAFITIWYHSLRVGSDVGTFPFSLLHTPMFVVILAISILKIRGYFQYRISKGKKS